jgi:hypothetical protein
MKKKIFNLFPQWFRILPHSDKIVHAILGTLMYLMLLLFLASHYAFFITVGISLAIEMYDEFSGKGTPDILDAIATIIIPFLLFLIF